MLKILFYLNKFKNCAHNIQKISISALNIIKKTHLPLLLAGIIFIIYGFLAHEKLIIILNFVFIGLIIAENIMKFYLLSKIPNWLKKPFNTFFQIQNNFFCFFIFIVLLWPLSHSLTISSPSPSSSPSPFLPFLNGFLFLLLLLLWLHIQSISSSLLLIFTFIILFVSLPLFLLEILLLLLCFLLLFLILPVPTSHPSPSLKHPLFFSPHILEQEDLIYMLNSNNEVLYKSEKLSIDFTSRRFRVLKQGKSPFKSEEVVGLMNNLFSKGKDLNQTLNNNETEIWLTYEDLLDEVAWKKTEEERVGNRKEEGGTKYNTSTKGGDHSKIHWRREEGGVDWEGRGDRRGMRGDQIGRKVEPNENYEIGKRKSGSERVVGVLKEEEGRMGKNGNESVSKIIIGRNIIREEEGEKITDDIQKNKLTNLSERKRKKKDLIGGEKEDKFAKKNWTVIKRDSKSSYPSVFFNQRKKKGSFTCSWDETIFTGKMGESTNQIEENYYILEMQESSDQKEFLFLVKKGGFLTFVLKKEFFFKCFNQMMSELEHKIKIVHQLEHEFRTSLNCIVSMLQTISQAVDEDIMFLCVSPALTSSMFLLNLINDMVDFMQLEAKNFKLKMVDFNLYTILEDTMNVISIQSQNRGIKLNLECEPNLFRLVRNDPHRIKQIVTNLLYNAVKHTHQGSIVLRAYRCSPSQIEISVQDTGFGFSIEEQTSISKDLARNDFSYENNFLTFGLKSSSLIAKKLNERGTSLFFSSVQNVGTTFKFLVDDFFVNASEEIPESFHKVEGTTFMSVKLLKDLMDSSYWTKSFSSKKVKGSRNTIYNKSQSSKSSGISLTKNNVTLFFLEEAISKTEFTINFSNPNIVQYQIDKVKNKMNSVPCYQCPFALIIDDNDFNVMALKLLLSKLDINASFALSVDEGMKKIKDLANRNCCKFYKIIFLDIEMPIKDGFVGYAEINEFYKITNFKFLNIVALTAHNPSSDIVKDVETKCGIEVYSKPLSQEGLLLIIKKTLKKYKKFMNGN